MARLEKTLFCGMDIGSRTGKIAILNRDRELLFFDIIKSVASAAKTYFNLLETIPAELKRSIATTAVTGYGRESVSQITKLSATEITCHFLGTVFMHPEILTIIDIGGQDSKVITIDNNKRIKDFIMNDKCAAGTGRFLEVMSERLGVSIGEFAELDVSLIEAVKINSTCTVFAESEAISMISKDVPQEVILSSLARMAAINVYFMAAKIHPAPPIFMSGGVSKLKPVKFHLEKLFKRKIISDEFSQFMGAIGAALFALKNGDKK